jgi:septum formation protein
VRLILASTSPRRADLLRESGVSFRIEAPEVEEWSAEDFPEIQPGELARGNARRKARAVAERHPGQPVLAADTIVVCEGRVLGKPADEEMAKKMLGWLSGRTHEVVTGVVLVLPDGKKIRESVVRTRVKFRSLETPEVEAYVKEVDVLDKAGAYALQDGGDRLVERVEGSRSNVIGLPMETVLPWCEELVLGAGT